jgi:hypothetical protein
LSVVLDVVLVDAVRAAARGRGMSVTGFVEAALEVAVNGEFDAVAGGASGVAVAGVGVRSVGGRGGESDSVDSAVGGVDWDALLAAGRLAKVQRDPIEDIA